jgi:hypothetical protein
VLFGIVVLLAALYALGNWGQDKSNKGTLAATATPTRTATPTATATPRRRASGKKTVPKVVSLRLTARRLVYVCVVDARGKAVVNGVNLQAGARTKALRSSRFRMNLGNAGVKLTANGKTYAVQDTGRPIGYELRPGRKPVKLSESVRAGLCK